ncbi:MAG: hypothetical protein WKF71_11565 [Pyrinomonadaceae bacterium]
MSKNARASINCADRARCVKSPETTTKCGVDFVDFDNQTFDNRVIDAPEMNVGNMNE